MTDANFEAALTLLGPQKNRTLAVAAAEDDFVLRAVAEAYKRKIATPILCGNKDKIKTLADRLQIDISPFKLVPASSDKESAQAAVSLVRHGNADMLMKGLLQTSDLLRAVLDKENGLRSDEVLSHVSILHSPVLKRIILLTDAAMIPYPDLKAKVHILKNAVKAAKGMGINSPKVAPLAAVEVINPAMPATIDAAALTVMNLRGQLKNCVVDGPLAMDLAISLSAAEHKGLVSKVAGKADILLFHNIEAANSALKVFTIAGGCLFGGVIMGATAPIVLTSRSDSDQSKLYSIACAASICGDQ